MAATNNEVWQLATVVESEPIATDIRRIVLQASNPAKADPGSHLDVKVRIDGLTHKRSYSIVESIDNGRRLAISVFKAPLSRGGSIFMHNLRIGDTLEVTQPLQNFPLRVGAERYLLLAGGIGITAIARMARTLRALNADYRLIYVGRNRSAMAYLKELVELHDGRIDVHVDDEATSLRVDDVVASADGDTELYMCGPIRLMDAVRRSWATAEHGPANLRYETFGNSGWYDPEEFIVSVPRLGVEARVMQGESMLEALESAGVEMMSDCRKGECGLCEVRILELDAVIDHRDVFYSERQKQASARMCCCVSRAVSRPGATAHDHGNRTAPPRITIDVS